MRFELLLAVSVLADARDTNTKELKAPIVAGRTDGKTTRLSYLDGWSFTVVEADFLTWKG
ncbi:hypothetical protein ACFWMR_15105 [Amycolatopsis thailandensis]|uniref:hypothetical protein n=1 Tax=Amycolatopsis thailandensis TaxID=589330 RepID=UPI0036610F97